MKIQSRVAIVLALVLLPLGGGLSLLSLQPGGCLAKTEVGDLVAHLTPMDKIHVEADDGLDPAKIDVVLDVHKILDVDHFHETTRIVHSGVPDAVFPMEYGENNFSIFYGGVLVLEKRQFKCARWSYHSYLFRVSKQKDGTVSGSMSCLGPDRC